MIRNLELQRKFVHVLFCSSMVLIFALPSWLFLTYIIFSALCVAIFELSRLHIDHRYNVFYRVKLYRILINILREKEVDGKLSGASYMLISVLLLYYKVNIHTFVLAFLIAGWADSAASIIGHAYGTTPILGKKTIQGSMAFFITALLICIVYDMFISPKMINNKLIGCLIVTLAELISSKVALDDNLLVPVTVALTYTIV